MRFLFWVADFAFVFNVSVELFVFINEIIYDSGTAIILYNLVLTCKITKILKFLLFFISGILNKNKFFNSFLVYDITFDNLSITFFMS